MPSVQRKLGIIYLMEYLEYMGRLCSECDLDRRVCSAIAAGTMGGLFDIYLACYQFRPTRDDRLESGDQQIRCRSEGPRSTATRRPISALLSLLSWSVR